MGPGVSDAEKPDGLTPEEIAEVYSKSQGLHRQPLGEGEFDQATYDAALAEGFTSEHAKAKAEEAALHASVYRKSLDRRQMQQG